MANQKQLEVIKLGSEAWNVWLVKATQRINIDLREADLSKADLSRANLISANLIGANLIGAKLTGATLFRARLDNTNLYEADLREADLREADLSKADLYKTDLRGADLIGATLFRARLNNANLYGADLREADLREADLSKADLREADLSRANLIGTNLTGANLTGAKLQYASFIKVNVEETILKGCHVYGLAAWDLEGIPQDQSNLVITKSDDPIVTIDDLQVAQFIYLLLNNKNVRNVLDTITSKAVLILGRFTPERKIVLDTIANELRKNNLLPIIFDFDRPIDRDFTETIKTLAGLSLFVIADVTNPKSSPLELQATIPDYQIPFVTIIQQNEKPFSMFSDLQSKYDWVLPVIEYDSVDNLIIGFEGAILNRAWSKHQELQLKKAKEVKVLSIKDFMKEK